jgi:predicted RNase H-like nuclease (RuvC/YqgF family)
LIPIYNIDKDQKLFELPQNAHERDALAAAVKTYRDHINKFHQIEKRAEKANYHMMQLTA